VIVPVAASVAIWGESVSAAQVAGVGLALIPISAGLERLFPETPSLGKLRHLVAAEDQPVRVLNVHSNEVLTGNSTEVFGLHNVSGYSSWALGRYYAYAELTGARVVSGSESSRAIAALTTSPAQPGRLPETA